MVRMALPWEQGNPMHRAAPLRILAYALPLAQGGKPLMFEAQFSAPTHRRSIFSHTPSNQLLVKAPGAPGAEKLTATRSPMRKGCRGRG